MVWTFHHCARRFQIAAQIAGRQPTARPFTSSTTVQRSFLPTFSESSNGKLNEVLSVLREKHFIPACLGERERRLIFKQKHRQQVNDNPPVVTVGHEDIQLRWIDRNREIPNRGKLVTSAINLIVNGEAKDWQNLPKLLEVLAVTIRKPLDEPLMEKIIRQAVKADQMDLVIVCLQKGDRTGMTLKSKIVLRNVLLGLHATAQKASWSQGATAKALKQAHVVADLLESETHGTGKQLGSNDPRTRPEVLGLFLELSAAYAYLHAEKKDTHGLVKTYTDRLSSCLSTSNKMPEACEPGLRQWPMLTVIPIWHGLSLAQAVLHRNLLSPEIVKKKQADYETRLSKLVMDIKARKPIEGSYAYEAVEMWDACIRPPTDNRATVESTIKT